MSFGAPILSNSQRNAIPRWLQNAREDRANELAIAQLQIDAKPNRTPSAALLARLGLTGGGDPRGQPSAPPLPNLPGLPDNFDEDRQRILSADRRPDTSGDPFGPLTLNRPPRIDNDLRSRLSQFLNQQSRI